MSALDRVRLAIVTAVAAAFALMVWRYETARAAQPDLRSWSQWTRLPGQSFAITETICFGEDRLYRTLYGGNGVAIAVVPGGCK